MCKFPGKILMLAAIALLLSVGVAVADPSNSDWNDSWGFPTPAEKANTLNQAIAIEFVEEDGFNINTNRTTNNSFFNKQNCNTDGACFNENEYQLGNTIAIGSQVNVDVNGDNNNITGNNATTDGNVAAQNNGDDIEQEIENENGYGYPN